MPVCHYVTISMVEFANDLSTLILQDSCVSWANKFPENAEQVSTLLWLFQHFLLLKYFGGWRPSKNNKNNKSVSFFLPTTKYNRDLHARKTKKITTVNRATTVSCSIKQELFFLSIKSHWDTGILKDFCSNLSLIVLIKFVLITVCCQFTKLTWRVILHIILIFTVRYH